MTCQKRILITLLFVGLVLGSAAYAADQQSELNTGMGAPESAFSPHQGATALVLKTIGEAKASIYVAAYSFTSKPIADALVQAFQRGVDVKVVLDKKQNSKRSLYLFMVENQVPTLLNHRYAIMHDKFIIVDGDTLELGSFNYTKSAEDKNAENVLVIHDPATISNYTKQWQKLWSEAEQESDSKN